MEPISLALYGGAELLNGLMNLYGMNKQAEENRKTREANKEMFETQLGFEKEEFGKKFALGLRQQEFSEKATKWQQGITEKQLTMQQEQENFKRQAELMNGFTAMINSRPQIRQNLIQTWGSL